MKGLTLVAIGIFSAGCYTLEPAGGIAPSPGTNVAFDVNDAGRVALGGAMGPEIGQVAGRLLSKDPASGEYLVAVSDIRLIRGGQQAWRGEQVRIKPEYVSTVYLRQLSKGRSYALAAIGVGAIAFIAGRSIIGAGEANQPVVPNDTGIQMRRPRLVGTIKIAFPPVP